MSAYEDYKAKLAALNKKKKDKQAQIKTSQEQIPLLSLLSDKTKVSDEKARINTAISKTQEQINLIDAKISEEKVAFAKIKSDREKAKHPDTYVPSNLPQGVDDRLFQDLKQGLPIGTDIDTIFKQGGLGNTMLVYTGKKDIVAGRPSSGGIKTGQQANDLQLVPALQQSFWTDSKIKNRVKTLLAAAGKPNDDLTAFSTWQSVVTYSAQIYNGGKGPELTPFDIMQMQIKNSGGGPQKDITKVDQNVLKTLVENVYSNVAMRKPTPAEMQARLQELNKFVDAGTVTSTNGSVTTRSAGYTQAGAEALIKQKVEKEAPTDVARVQGLQFKDEISSWMRSGI
jgi:hypothetical protein